MFLSAFYSKGKSRFVIHNIFSETIYCFRSFALFSNIYHKINYMAKNGFDLYNSYSNFDF